MYSDARSEINRAQTQINQKSTVHEALDGSQIAYPNWRSIEKKRWMDRKHPFRVNKADEKLICNRSPNASSNTKAYPIDPYTGIVDSKPPRGLDGRFTLPRKEVD